MKIASIASWQLVIGLTIENDKITEFDVIADPDRLRTLDLAVLDP